MSEELASHSEQLVVDYLNLAQSNEEPQKSDALDVVKLSAEEVAFAILTESHSLACQALYDLALAAIKHNNLHDWKKKISGCFSLSLRLPVQESLETGSPITDIYIVLKVIRCRIHDVARFCGGTLLDPRIKERLCLRIQGVETVRNWAFHGQSISTGEVFTSTAYLFSILQTLNITGPLVKILSRLIGSAFQLCSGEQIQPPLSRIIVSARNLRRTLLYGVLQEFETEFCKLFHGETGRPNEILCPGGQRDHNHTCDISSLVKEIKKEICRPKKERKFFARLSSRKTIEYPPMCQTVLLLRNKLAHYQEISGREFSDLLENVSQLFAAFSINLTEKTKSTPFRHLGSNGEPINECTSFVIEVIPSNRTSGKKNESEKNPQRILRSRGQHFVGRQNEINSILNFFTSQAQRSSCQIPTPSACVLFGPPGIGKSYLATEVAARLRNLYPRQVWLSCSNEVDFFHDVNSVNQYHNQEADPLIWDLLPSSSPYPPTGKCKGSCVLNNESSVYGSSTQGLTYVLDDVCTPTLSLICKKILNSSHNFIITTRSTTIKSILANVVKRIRVFRLKLFSPRESWDLINLKSGPKAVQAASLIMGKEILQNVLDGLPLCISIFADRLAFFNKKHHENNSVYITVENLPSVWKEIEEEFGDQHHVRGLTGVIVSAEYYLRDHPMAVFLLNKICLANSKSISWEVLSKNAEAKFCSQWLGKTYNDLNVHLRRLLRELDWLFTTHGQRTLQECRDVLQELGLLSWCEATGTIYIHRLTLKSAQDLLEKNNLYLVHLADSFIGKSYAQSEVIKFAKSICDNVRSMQLIQLIDKCAELLRDQRKWFSARADVISAYCFLLKITWNNQRMNMLRHQVMASQFEKLRFSIFLLLSSFEQQLVYLSVTNTSPPVYWADYGDAPPDCWKYCIHLYLLQMALNVRHYKVPFRQSAMHWQFYQDISRWPMDEVPFLIELMHMHGFKTPLIQMREDSLTGSDFLTRALTSSNCSELTMEPTLNQLSWFIINTKAAIFSLEHNQKIELWQPINYMEELWDLLIRIRVKHSLEVKGTIGQATRDPAMMLIYNSQLKQHFWNEMLKRTSVHTGNNFTRLLYLQELFHSTNKEQRLWLDLKRRGRSLRALLKTFLAMINSGLWPEYVHSVPLVQNLLGIGLDRHIPLSCCLYSFRLGHFSLTMRIARTARIYLHMGNTQPVQEAWAWNERQVNGSQSEELQDCIKVISDSSLLRLTSVLYFEIFALLFMVKRFPETLDVSISLLQRFQSQKMKDLAALFLFPGMCAKGLIYQIGWLGALLGNEETKKVQVKFEAFAKDINTPESWKNALQNTSEQINNCCKQIAIPLHTLYRHFVEAIEALNMASYVTARKAALTCWRNLENITAPMQEVPYCIIVMALELFECLKQIYIEDKKFKTAEWFFRYCVSYARKLSQLYQVAVYALDYARFLKDRQRWSEALEQCRRVEHELVEDFGDDYLEWLPSGLGISDLLTTLEERVSCIVEKT